VVSSVVVVVWVTGGGLGAQPANNAAPTSRVAANPWLKCDIVVVILSLHPV
jgi:hypothetical protein